MTHSVSMQSMKALLAQYVLFKQWEIAFTCFLSKVRAGLAYVHFALLNETWNQEMSFDALSRNGNMCILREDNSYFAAKALSQFVRKQLQGKATPRIV